MEKRVTANERFPIFGGDEQRHVPRRVTRCGNSSDFPGEGLPTWQKIKDAKLFEGRQCMVYVGRDAHFHCWLLIEIPVDLVQHVAGVWEHRRSLGSKGPAHVVVVGMGKEDCVHISGVNFVFS